MALSQTGLRRWCVVHKWTSLVATAFLLLLCLTGLPLVFHHEIDALTRAPVLEAGDDARRASLDDVIAAAVEANPGTVPLYLTYELDEPLVYATVAPAVDAPESRMTTLPFDARSGALLRAPPLDEGVMAFLLDLHASLLLGLPGTLGLGLVALVFLAAIVSGVVVYAPFMRRLVFGTVRRERSARLKWLDTHNLFGIVTTGWLAVVSFTGFVLAMETPITLLWQSGQLAELTAPWQGSAVPERPVPVERARAAALAGSPDSAISFIAWPGTPFSSRHHYLVALRGDTPLTERLVRVALVDAATGELSALRSTPWYVTAAFVSVPLHFGDYGGLALKVLWALLDVAAIVVLGTGLYLWVRKGNVPFERRIAALHGHGEAAT